MKRAQEAYDAQNTFRVTVKLNRKTDAELIEALEKAGSRQGMIREALREYLRGESVGR